MHRCPEHGRFLRIPALNQKQQTLMLALEQYNLLSNEFSSRPDPGQQTAGFIPATIPRLIVFSFGMKYFIKRNWASIEAPSDHLNGGRLRILPWKASLRSHQSEASTQRLVNTSRSSARTRNKRTWQATGRCSGSRRPEISHISMRRRSQSLALMIEGVQDFPEIQEPFAGIQMLGTAEYAYNDRHPDGADGNVHTDLRALKRRVWMERSPRRSTELACRPT